MGIEIPSPHHAQVSRRGRGYLPHWEMQDGVYSVTFRLGDSLPESALARLREERETALAALEKHGGTPTPADLRRLEDVLNDRVEAYLNAGAGACYMARPEIGRLVADAIRHFEGQRYRLFAWCVMPNHVHVVLRFAPGHGLERTLHSWKSYTSKAANRALGRSGSFWAREYYDHLVRDEDDFARVVAYVAQNPVKAGLRDWPWVWVSPECGV
jgi:REP element-mobilizing transposase RayT